MCHEQSIAAPGCSKIHNKAPAPQIVTVDTTGETPENFMVANQTLHDHTKKLLWIGNQLHGLESLKLLLMCHEQSIAALNCSKIRSKASAPQVITVGTITDTSDVFMNTNHTSHDHSKNLPCFGNQQHCSASLKLLLMCHGSSVAALDRSKRHTKQPTEFPSRSCATVLESASR